MSLIPSESSNFPDLIGQRHTYQNPKPKRARRGRVKKEAASEIQPEPAPPPPSPPPEADFRETFDSENGFGHEVAFPATSQPIEIAPAEEAPMHAEPPPPAPPPEIDFGSIFNPGNGFGYEVAFPETSQPIEMAPVHADSPPPLPPTPPPEIDFAETFDPGKGIGYDVSLPEAFQPIDIAPVEKGPAEVSTPIRKAKPVPLPRSVVQLRSSSPRSRAAREPRPPRLKTPAHPHLATHSGTSQPPRPHSPAHPVMASPAEVPRHNLPRYRNPKLTRFISYEVAAMVVLVFSARLGLSHQLPNDPMALLSKFLTITAAVAAVIIPIIFYGLPERFPKSGR